VPGIHAVALLLLAEIFFLDSGMDGRDKPHLR